MNLEFKVEGGDFTAAGNASSQIKKMLKQLNVDPRVVKRVVIALYEAEVNIVAHAYRGVITAEILPSAKLFLLLIFKNYLAKVFI